MSRKGTPALRAAVMNARRSVCGVTFFAISAVTDLADDPGGAAAVQPLPVPSEEDPPIDALADGQVDRPGGARRERAGDHLAALGVTVTLIRWSEFEDLGALSRSGSLRLTPPVGEVGAGSERVGVLVAQDPLPGRQQRGVLVAGRGWVSGLTGPVGEAGAGGERVGVLAAQDPLPVLQRISAHARSTSQ
jgi:hypothetical protein